MATCNDCMNSGICEIQLEPHYLLDRGQKLMRESNNVEHECLSFKECPRFVELPCKVGDTVYWDILGKPVEDEITNITIYDNCTRVFLKKGISFDIEDIGRMIFLSREQAEQALKGGSEKNGKC